jgi:hypothetical protein
MGISAEKADDSLPFSGRSRAPTGRTTSGGMEAIGTVTTRCFTAPLVDDDGVQALKSRGRWCTELGNKLSIDEFSSSPTLVSQTKQ